jgi:hypothetical protein
LKEAARREPAPSLTPQKRRPAMVRRKMQQRTKIRIVVGRSLLGRASAQPRPLAKQPAETLLRWEDEQQGPEQTEAHFFATEWASRRKGWPCESGKSDRDRKAKASDEGQGGSDGHHVCLSERSES